MRCLCPILIKDKFGYVQQVPCGQCLHCRLNHARMWSIRIENESRQYKDNVFLTLTYDDEHLPPNGSLVKEDLTLFFKRFRKAIGKPVRYFACGEYGDKYGRPHYHIIFFNVSERDKVFKDLIYDPKTHGYHCVCPSWDKGLVHIGFVTIDSANYVAGYVVKKQKGLNAKKFYADRGIIPEFVVMSRRPGIGSAFLEANKGRLAKKNYVVCKGFKYALPRYYADRLGNWLERRKVAAEQDEARRQQLEADAQRNGKSVYQWSYEVDLQAEANTKARLNLKEKTL